MSFLGRTTRLCTTGLAATTVLATLSISAATAVFATLSISPAAASTSTTSTTTTTTTTTPATTQTQAPSVAPWAGQSYSLVTSTGNLVGYGAAVSGIVPTGGSTVVGVAPTPDGLGAWVAEANGAVLSVGDAVSHGSLSGSKLNEPIVGITADPATGGYWLVASDGGVFAFDAPFLGSTGAVKLWKPIVGMASSADGLGYWLVASDGGVFAFGDAVFQGSTGGMKLNEPVVGMATAPNGGYWLVASDGGIFSFGGAQFWGSTGAIKLWEPIVGMAAAPGGGYWLVASDGGIFSFGGAPFWGSASSLHQQVVGMAVEQGGYRNPLRAVTGLTPERIDQGVDYGGGGPIYALGDAVILNTVNSGWPGGAFISYQLLDGPAKGLIVYAAENVVPGVKVGQQVNSNTVIGNLINAYPNLEIGWAATGGKGEAAAGAAGLWSASTDSEDVPTIYGENFSSLLVSLGAPAGLSKGQPAGTLPAGWPTW